MKKVPFVGLVFLIATGAFADNKHLFSFGLMEGVSWEQRNAHSEGQYQGNTAYSGSETQSSKATGLTLGFFADFTFVEASLSVLGQLGPYHVEDSSNAPGLFSQSSSPDLDTRLVNANIRILGKWPIRVRDVMLFPLAGPEYSRNLYVNRNPRNGYSMTDDDISELTNWFVDVGGGADFPMGDLCFLRLEALYGINMNPLNHQVKNQFTGSYTFSGSRTSFNLALGFRP
jgi:hypothetical protein